MKRKIIQIEVITETFFGCITGIRQYALCDDGTIWYRMALNKNDCEWHQITSDIPGTLK